MEAIKLSKMQFIQIANFSEEANKIINQAIYFSKEENCAEVNLVHLFLAILDKSEIGERILDKLDVTFEMMHNSYRSLAEERIYGYSEDDRIGPDQFTEEMLKLISMATLLCSMHGKYVDTEYLFDDVLASDSEELNYFLEYVGVTLI